MNVKFTEDGKKVEVIGALNSGDYFIVKKLLDYPQTPSEEHKKRTLEEDVIKLEKKKAALEKNIRDAEYKSAASVARLKWIEGITDKEAIEAVDNIKSMLSGEYTHVVFNDYKLEIKEWDIKLFSGKYDNRQIWILK